MIINGPGSANVNPLGNLFATNETVSVTATPFAGQGFISWSGDAGGTGNPLSVAMTQSRVLTANFTNWPVLIANHQSITSTGFQFKLVSGPGLAYTVQSSTNLNHWTSLGVVSNTTGETDFTDAVSSNSPIRFYRGVPAP